MNKIITPAARVSQTEGFKPFGLQVLNDVEVFSNRGNYTEGAKAGQPKTDMFKGKDSEGTIRIIMADEAAAVNNAIIAKYQDAARVQAKDKTPKGVRKQLFMNVGHLALLHTEDSLIAEEGEEAVWAENAVARTDKGLVTE